MSFVFQWPKFSDQFHADAIQLLESALNKGNKPPVIADRIEVVELDMGSQPPELEIRDIGDLTLSQFRGIFRFSYSGDAYIVLRTKVQANPLYHKRKDIHLMGGSRGMLAANQPLVVPMLLRLSNFKLNSYVVLVVSKPKGITLVFKTDPLQNVDINSTFDSITVIQKFIQQEIENQLRQMFREDLPSIIHRLSQRWVRSTTVEAPYLTRRTAHVVLEPTLHETRSNPDLKADYLPMAHAWEPSLLRHAHGMIPRPSLGQRAASFSARSFASAMPSFDLREHAMRNAFSDAQSYAGGFPSYSILGRMQRTNRGLGEVTEGNESVLYSESDASVDEAGSFDVVEWEDTVPDISPASVFADAEGQEEMTEYETIPAVGGGYVSRPRVYHAASRPHGPSRSNSSSSTDAQAPTHPALQDPADVADNIARRGQRPYMHRGRSIPSIARLRADAGASPRVPAYAASSQGPSRMAPNVQVPYSYQYAVSESGRSNLSQQEPDSSSPTPVGTLHPHRRNSVSARSASSSQFPPSPIVAPEPDAQIVLQPGLNSTVAELSLLNHSHQTLSPYGRTLEHFTVRSAPPKAASSTTAQAAERQPVKARRKRTYRLGGSTTNATSAPRTPPAMTPPMSPNHPPHSPSDFDESEINRYFRPHEDLVPDIGLHGSVVHVPLLPQQPPPRLRRRTSFRSHLG